jgi:dynein light chain LC8-type
MANFIKKQLEEKYRDKDVCWHVIVGRHFGGFLTYQEKIYTYFYIGQIGFMIFATVSEEPIYLLI